MSEDISSSDRQPNWEYPPVLLLNEAPGLTTRVVLIAIFHLKRFYQTDNDIVY